MHIKEAPILMPKKWGLISPDGEIYEVNGSLQRKCDELGIIRTTLSKNIGNAVPPISPKYRDTGNLEKDNAQLGGH